MHLQDCSACNILLHAMQTLLKYMLSRLNETSETGQKQKEKYGCSAILSICLYSELRSVSDSKKGFPAVLQRQFFHKNA